MPRAVYPGTFDPVTLGHLDLIRRGSRLFTELIVLVAVNPRKTHLFTAKERVELIRGEIGDLGNVSVQSAEGLTVDFVRSKGFDTILRGIRTTADFVGEHRMALTNRTLAPELETVFMAPGLEWSFLSSTLIREVAASGGDVSPFLPAAVAEAVRERASAG